MDKQNEKRNTLSAEFSDDANFYKEVADLLIAARKYAKKQVDNTIAVTYFEVGRMIVEREQKGEKRAKYGAKIINGLSEHLTEQLGKGFSVPTLKNIRQFYLVYSPTLKSYSPISLLDGTREQMSSNDEYGNDEKSYSLISLFSESQKSQVLSDRFILTWTHYQVLMRVKNEDARKFYELEAEREQWSVK